MKCKLKTITPLFIGSGNDIEPYEYLLENNKYSRLNLDIVFKLMADYDISLVDKFGNWVNENSEKLLRERDNQLQSQIRQKFKIINFLKLNKLPDNEIKKVLNNTKSSLYSFDISYQVGKFKQLKEILKTTDYKPYIPGSSIKGAIRTALAFHYLINMVDSEINNLINGINKTDIKGIKKILNDRSSNLKYLGNQLGKEIEKVIFFLGREPDKLKEKIFERVYNDEKFDIMKIVTISDSYYSKAEFDLVNLNIFKKNKNPRKTYSSFDIQPIGLAEVISENSEFYFDLSLNLNYLIAIRNNFREKKDDQSLYELERKTNYLFGLDINYLNNNSIKEGEQRFFNHIKAILKEFSNEILNKEKFWYNQFDIGKINFLFKSYQNIHKNSNDENILLRLGSGMGFFSCTVGLAFLNNPELKKQLENIFKRYAIGVSPSIKRAMIGRDRKIDFNKFPISRILLEENYKPISSLGWLSLKYC
jgi:CRISPR-associated protein Csm5